MQEGRIWRRWGAAGALLLSVAAALPALAAPPPPGSFASRALDVHNQERAAVGVPLMEWDETLAAHAAEWAGYLLAIGSLVHSPEDDQTGDPEGENLWAGTHGAYTPEEMIGLWTEEKLFFVPGRFPDNSRSGNVADVAHYTQVVWRSSTRVGCAIAEGEEDDFLVCRYKEAGNVIGERPF
ncbi:CAP domain-containing protein [Sphingomonas sp. ID0503]|uniref:CAP domain-containing protein n=1 Tax=Sphingomonas sp. ID0503 TaxID=3399691 RepID=UPI003AFA8711